MPDRDAFALQQSGLNEFLYSSVGVEPNGMALSVVSLFARLGADPWREAGRLAGLPRTEAVAALAQIIATMPAGVWSLPDAQAIASRLIALLPSRSGHIAPRPAEERPASDRSLPERSQTGKPAMPQAVRMGLIVAGIVLGALFFSGVFSGRDAPKPDGGDISSLPPAPATVPAVTAPSPPVPPADETDAPRR